MNNHNHPVRAELQSLDQRRADTLADALRPVALTDDTPTPETWRVVEPDGSVNMLRVQDIGGGVYIIRCDSLGREHVRAASSRCAVERFAGQYLGAAEIRGPGEATTAEQLATRDAEIARLGSVCDDLQTAWLTASAERDAALAAVDAVRADYAPRAEPPTADEVRAVSQLWGRDHAVRCVAWRSDEHGRWSESWNTEGCAAEVKASPNTTYMLFGPTGPVAWSELAAMVARGGDRG